MCMCLLFFLFLKFWFVYLFCLYVWFLKRKIKDMGLGVWEGGKELGGVEGGKTIIRLYCMKTNLFTVYIRIYTYTHICMYTHICTYTTANSLYRSALLILLSLSLNALIVMSVVICFSLFCLEVLKVLGCDIFIHAFNHIWGNSVIIYLYDLCLCFSFFWSSLSL